MRVITKCDWCGNKLIRRKKAAHYFCNLKVCRSKYIIKNGSLKSDKNG